MSEHGGGSGSAANHKNCFAYKVLLVHTQCSSDSGDFLYVYKDRFPTFLWTFTLFTLIINYDKEAYFVV